MNARHAVLSLLLVGAAASTVAAASPLAGATWVVDDDGGAGVDFTTLEAALAVATHGDVILLHEGDYTPPGFVLEFDQGITLRADPVGADVDVDVELVVRDLAPGRVAAFEGFEVSALRAQDCSGVVRVEGMSTGWLVARGSTYVSVANSDVFGWLACPFPYPCVESAAVVGDAYVEFSNCRIEGDSDLGGNSGRDGSNGLHVEPGGVVRFVNSYARGGFGGDGSCLFPSPAGDGGDGMLVDVGARVLIEGSLGPVPALGNVAGFGCSAMYDGEYGVDLNVSGFVQLFGVELTDFMTLDQAPGAVIEEDDFVARLDGDVDAAAVTLDVQGRPGASATLLFARRPSFTVLPAIDEPLLVDALRIFPVGALDGGGALHLPIPLPPGVAPGTRLTVQALVVDASGRRLSNAVLLRVP